MKDPKRVAAGHKAWALTKSRKDQGDKLVIWLRLHGIEAKVYYWSLRRMPLYDKHPDLPWRLTIYHNTPRRFERKYFAGLEAMADTIIKNWPYCQTED